MIQQCSHRNDIYHSEPLIGRYHQLAVIWRYDGCSILNCRNDKVTFYDLGTGGKKKFCQSNPEVILFLFVIYLILFYFEYVVDNSCILCLVCKEKHKLPRKKTWMLLVVWTLGSGACQPLVVIISITTTDTLQHSGKKSPKNIFFFTLLYSVSHRRNVKNVCVTHETFFVVLLNKKEISFGFKNSLIKCF